MAAPTSPYGAESPRAAYAYPERANVKMSEALRVLDEGVHPLVIHSSQILAAALLVTAAVNHFPKITVADLAEIWRSLQIDVAYAFALTAVAVLLLGYYALRHPRPVYLVDFATWQLRDDKDDGSLSATSDFFRSTITDCGNFCDESVDFQMKLFERNQISERCYFPPGIRAYRKGERDFDFSMAAARKEFETVVFTTVDELLAKTGVKPRDIDILVVNCSLFNPTPSLAAIVINHYQMKDSVQSYSLGGMGCSAGLISIHLAKDLLQVYPRKRALVISTENITQNFYQGNEKSMLISNTLFRMGGAAVLLSGRHADRRVAKYQLLHTVRTHKGADPDAYRCVFQEEDKAGHVGVRLSKDVMECAGAAMKTNISVLAPLILPVSEQVRFLANYVARKWLRMKGVKGYVPDFTTAVQHFCIHTGGRAVLDALQANLSLSDYYLEPSRYSLWRWGNVSSASVWYELDWLEKSGRIRRGDKVWQIGFGSGFKCNSAVWRACRAMP
uniref:3-ketoacyl-CoA synthase n=1 Tax=Diacronema lutheri TaxID=2081491 RepID=Q49LY0_DIALT|nr:beta-ketoacyl-CoA synthase [Diacronema lutheri]